MSEEYFLPEYSYFHYNHLERFAPSKGDIIHGNFEIFSREQLKDIPLSRLLGIYHIKPLSEVTPNVTLDPGDQDHYDPGCSCTAFSTYTTTHISYLSELLSIHSKYQGEFLLGFSYYESLDKQDLEYLIESQTNPEPELIKLAESKECTYDQEYNKLCSLKSAFEEAIRKFKFKYNYPKSDERDKQILDLTKIDPDSY